MHPMSRPDDQCDLQLDWPALAARLFDDTGEEQAP
jgi:hypothetical protein